MCETGNFHRKVISKMDSDQTEANGDEQEIVKFAYYPVLFDI